jgi:RNA polymerase sigma-70 factor (ECF subfamily)
MGDAFNETAGASTGTVTRELSPARRLLFEREAMPLFDSLYPGALSLTKNRPDADDLMQETALKAFRSFHQYQEGTNLKAWLYRIMMNSYISKYRRKKRSPELGWLDGPEDAVGGTTPEQAANERNAWLVLGDKLALEDFKQQLDGPMKAAVEALPDEFRSALILNVVNELSYKEVAEVLDVPIGTVMSRLSRAKALIRARLVADGTNGIAGI